MNLSIKPTTQRSLSIREAVYVGFILDTIKYSDVDILLCWLECNAYIPPAERKLYPSLISYILNTEYTAVTSLSEIEELHRKAYHITTRLTINEQERIYKWIRE